MDFISHFISMCPNIWALPEVNSIRLWTCIQVIYGKKYWVHLIFYQDSWKGGGCIWAFQCLCCLWHVWKAAMRGAWAFKKCLRGSKHTRLVTSYRSEPFYSGRGDGDDLGNWLDFRPSSCEHSRQASYIFCWNNKAAFLLVIGMMLCICLSQAFFLDTWHKM